MMQFHARISLWLTSLLCVSFCSVSLQAQKSMSSPHSVTGCLQKGVEPDGFTITGKDGTMWELSGKIDPAHIGHTVTVSGSVLHRSKTKEASYNANETEEAGGKQHSDFKVTSLKMVSDSCK
jgi:hypothetical protein